MRKKSLTKFFKIIGTFFLAGYILFLVLPFIVSPFLNKYCSDVEKIIQESTGLDTKISGLGLITSYKFDAGIRLKQISLYEPNKNDAFVNIENLRLSIALPPLFLRKVQLSNASADSSKISIGVKQDGNFSFLDCLPKNNNESENSSALTTLPYNLKLSNRLPNVFLKKYEFVFVDIPTSRSYSVIGNNLDISDFVLDKKIKFSTSGDIVFDGRQVSKYEVKISNHIMPKLNLDDLVFPKTVSEETSSSNNGDAFSMPFNIIEIFEAVNKNDFTADLSANIKVFGTYKHPNQRGYVSVDNLSVKSGSAKLPQSYAKLNFKGSKTDIDSTFYTSSDKNEVTKLFGSVNSGTKPSVDLSLRSNAKINNIFRLIDSIAQSFGVSDFKTLNATGNIDADFNLNSDFKKVLSSGYLKIPDGGISYGIYNIKVDNIKADVDFKDNNVNIKSITFSILNHALNLSGTVKSDTLTDLRLNADRLSIKGLLALAGQNNILKENDISSGTISVNALLKGYLKEIKPDIKLSVDNVNVLNRPSNLRVILNNALINLLIKGNNDISGDVLLKSLNLKTSDAMVSVPSAKINIDPNNILIKESYVVSNNSRVDVNGFVKNYVSDKMNISIDAKGSLSSNDVMMFLPADIRSMFPYKGSLPLEIKVRGGSKEQNISINLSANSQNYIQFADINLLKGKNTKIISDIKIASDTLSFLNTGIYGNSNQIASMSGEITKLSSNPNLNLHISVPKTVSFPIWGINNSNISLNGLINVSGSLNNPSVKGNVNLPDISIKELDFVLSNIKGTLTGGMFKGNATADKFKCGNIIAENISSKVELFNFTDFYLSDMSADSFNGKLTGKISYNIPKFKTALTLSGKNMDSTQSIYAISGIKNALTGVLNFNTNLSMSGVTDKEIIQSLLGDLDFTIDNGRFMSIGRLENFVLAQNIESTSILKSAISSLTTLHNLQETDQFKNIKGKLSFKSGVANIEFINVSGPLMSYHVSGMYNILPNSANLIILGRLDGKIVSYLGVVGELSAEKLLSYIPGIGVQTAKFLQLLTSNPDSEKISLIPPLSGGSSNFKDFKVFFNGPVESKRSVKYFKWLSKCDTSKIDLKQELINSKEAVKSNINEKVNSVVNTVETTKNNVQSAIQKEKDTFNQTKTDIQNIKNNAPQSASNIGKLLLNAAQKSQNKYEEPSQKTEQSTSSDSKTEDTSQKTEQTDSSKSSDSE